MSHQSALARLVAAAGLCAWLSASGCDRSAGDGAGGGGGVPQELACEDTCVSDDPCRVGVCDEREVCTFRAAAPGTGCPEGACDDHGTCHPPVWCDPKTGLCWQDPQKDAYTAADVGLRPEEAQRYCDELVLGGYDDWRVPTIDELRTLVAGHASTQTGGSCGVRSGSKTGDGLDPACLGGDEYAGPGADGCYWAGALTGTCDKPDPAVHGHPLETWASDRAVDDPERWVAYVTFDTGAVGFNHVCSYGDVRCVRTGDAAPPEQCGCGPCVKTDFSPDPSVATECDIDVCPQSDKLALTIHVPEKLPHVASQLLAFFYTDADWEFPPARPPDGGTDTNQILSPDIDVEKPLTIEIPGCTYYREALLSGAYHLYVHLQLEPKFPPLPVDGDFYYGKDAAPLTFPFDGEAHRQTVKAMDITLEPVHTGCSGDTSFACPDGSCVADPSLCPRSACDPVPVDDEVLTCRYQSSFAPNNCADFPVALGWSETGVASFCAAQAGADPATVVVRRGESCLVEKGGAASTHRCVASSDGKAWFAYGTPAFVCNAILGGTDQVGPFCQGY